MWRVGMEGARGASGRQPSWGALRSERPGTGVMCVLMCSCIRAQNAAKFKQNWHRLRIYGFWRACGAGREAATRIRESAHRRQGWKRRERMALTD